MGSSTKKCPSGSLANSSLTPGSPLLVQPGVDVAAPVARRPANLDECRPGPLLPPPFQRSQADLQLIGELLLGQEFLAHVPPRWSAGRILPGRGGPRHKLTGCGGLRRILTGHDGEGRTWAGARLLDPWWRSVA
jgi:hypothetical protein